MASIKPETVMPPPHHIRDQQTEKPAQGRAKGKLRFPVKTILVVGLVIASLNLPDRLNPLASLDPNAAPNSVTPIQLYRTALNQEACTAALEVAESLHYRKLDDLEASAQCHIRNRVTIRKVANSNMRAVETSCEIALRLYMWNRHVVQPAAARHFGQSVDEILHFDSYSCRKMRTPQGNSTSWSAHATAHAIDISGFVLADGRSLTLLDSWDDTDMQNFWREVRDGGCTWFRTLLSPDYNALHKDHFHLAQGRWMSCR